MNDTPSPAETAKSYGPSRRKVPDFARYVGTSAWRKDRRRAREYARFLAKHEAAEAAGVKAVSPSSSPH